MFGSQNSRVAKWAKVTAFLLFGGLLGGWLLLRPMRVETVSVDRGTVATEVRGTGTLEARFRSSLSSEISGRLVEVLVDQNDRVTTGQVLARLDDEDLRQQVAIAVAELDAARAAVARAEADGERAKAVLSQAESEHERDRHLLESRAISQSDFDQGVERRLVALAEHARSTAACAEAQRQVAAAQKRVELLDIRLGKVEIRSPFEGLVTRRVREPGDTVVPGAPILHLIALREFWVSAWVDESAISDVQIGQDVVVTFPTDPGTTRPGCVVRRGYEVDRKTREYLVDVRVDELPASWAVGQRADVRICVGRSVDVAVVPARALQWRDGKPSVLATRNGRARRVIVELGSLGDKWVEVASGVGIGDEILDLPPEVAHKVSDGQRVLVVR